MGMEIEWKYQATPEILEEIANSFSGKFEVFHMKTVYFDTPDRLLSAEKITLRIRRENDVSTATVKSPKQGLGRGEWECAGENMAQVLPVLAKESLRRSVPAGPPPYPRRGWCLAPWRGPSP